MSKFKFLVGLTGSVACFKTCSLISRLVREGHEVRVIATPSALKFVGTATLEGLSMNRVWTECFDEGHMMDHIQLARWADAFVVAPMTANHLNKFTLGLADDLLTTTYLAYEPSKPVFIAPAMNTIMYEHVTVQTSLDLLKNRGVHILEPGAGRLACAEEGVGKMMEPDEIFETVFSVLAPKTKRKKILITYGGTREPIDGVREISNISTGQTGQTLAHALMRMGYEVTSLAASYIALDKTFGRAVRFRDHAELESRLVALLQGETYDAAIHLAAVSDYTVDQISSGDQVKPPTQEIKLGSEKELTIKFKPTTKIVNRIKSESINKQIRVFAFKLTHTSNIIERNTAIVKLLDTPGIDYVVHNDMSEVHSHIRPHTFHVYGNDGFDKKATTKEELAQIIDQLLSRPASDIRPRSRGKLFEVENGIMS